MQVCQSLSDVSYNAFVLKKEQENCYEFEREIGGNMFPQEERVCFPCGNWAGAMLARVEGNLPECHLAQLQEQGDLAFLSLEEEVLFDLKNNM